MGDGSVSSSIAVRCACGELYTLAQWAELEFVGIQDDGIDTLLEFRNCTCGSTRARRCDAENVLRLVNDTAKRLRQALGRLRDIEKATAGMSDEIAAIDRGDLRDDVKRERTRAARIVRETITSVTLPGRALDVASRQEWVKTLIEILEARIAQG